MSPGMRRGVTFCWAVLKAAACEAAAMRRADGFAERHTHAPADNATRFSACAPICEAHAIKAAALNRLVASCMPRNKKSG